ncbi:alpha/beta fold hydrolase [Streptomyces sp. NBC_01723]|uniref:alpha/beta hydrolase n=1 Tax=unclassified Streptomyces TaxID=2593676 RepID=UPI0027D8432F|nr:MULTISPECIES: alpha/beta fold hydrolase [unclassified Streptomyces]
MPVGVKIPKVVHVVFVNGLFTSADLWDQFRKLLAADDDLRRVAVHCFPYESPVRMLRRERVISAYDDAAKLLDDYLRVQIPPTGLVVLVSHSQGGLIVQRFLTRTFGEGRGFALNRIAQIVMFGCPNNGSPAVHPARRVPFLVRQAQGRALRTYRREVVATREAVMRTVVRAERSTGSNCSIPIHAYGGSEDEVVPAQEARAEFPVGATVPGDHLQLVQPRDHRSASYEAVKQTLTRILAAKAAQPTAAGEPTMPSQLQPEEGQPGQGRQMLLPQQQGGVSVSPPYGRRRIKLHGQRPRSIIADLMAPTTEKGPRIHVLAGLGGSGKSRIALEAVRQAERTRRVWWVTVPQINTCMREVAHQLGVPTGEVEQAFRGEGSSIDLVWRYLEACTDPWLLVIDNADTPDRLAPEARQVAEGVGWVRQPERADGLVILTSRDRSAASWLPPCRVHQVPLLGDEDGAELLVAAAPQGGSREKARRLSVALGGLPLALHGAASYLNSVHQGSPSLDDPVIHDFDSYRESFEARSSSPPGTAARGLEEMLGMSAMTQVCGIALDLLAHQGLPQAAPLLRALACLGIAPIPYRPLLESRVVQESPLLPDFTRGRRNGVLKGLDDLGLIERISRPEAESSHLTHSLSLHPVVHALLRADPQIEHRRSEYYGLIVDLLSDVTRWSPPDEPQSWDIWTAIAPHVMEVVRACLTGGRHVIDDEVLRRALELARRNLRYLIVVGLLRPAHELADVVLDNCEAIGFNPGDEEILGIRHEKARIALESGDYPTAEAELRRVVARRQGLLGLDDPRTLASRHKLARSILEQFRFEEAEPHLRSIVQAELVVHGPDHSDTVAVRHSLARAMFALGRTSEAEAALREILQISLDKWSPSTMETLRIRQNLARCLMQTQRHEEAEQMIRRALEDTTQRSNSVLVMTLRHTLCQLLLIQGQLRRAHTETASLLTDRKQVLGSTHPETIRNQKLLDSIEDVLGRPRPKTEE